MQNIKINNNSCDTNIILRPLKASVVALRGACVLVATSTFEGGPMVFVIICPQVRVWGMPLVLHAPLSLEDAFAEAARRQHAAGAPRPEESEPRYTGGAEYIHQIELPIYIS